MVFETGTTDWTGCPPAGPVLGRDDVGHEAEGLAGKTHVSHTP